ncbi:MAG: hypothetical protein N2248_00650 [candidate division WOR-3 bacterium]|nr:hypothetical protein [candidate division WOR-3 bacterium]
MSMPTRRRSHSCWERLCCRYSSTRFIDASTAVRTVFGCWNWVLSSFIFRSTISATCKT